MARTKKSTTSTTTRRGSAEAIAKRKAARALNRLFEESGGAGADQIDGRTLKRKRRLLEQLTKGKGDKPLKALEVLTHANELLSLGETLSSLRKLKPKVPATPPTSEAAAAIYVETQKNYGFDPKAWRLLGIDIDNVGIAPEPSPKAAPRKKATRRARK